MSLRCGVLAAVEDGDAAAFAGEFLGDGESDAAGAADDDGGWVFEVKLQEGLYRAVQFPNSGKTFDGSKRIWNRG